jgi:hypothetical protein
LKAQSIFNTFSGSWVVKLWIIRRKYLELWCFYYSFRRLCEAQLIRNVIIDMSIQLRCGFNWLGMWSVICLSSWDAGLIDSECNHWHARLVKDNYDDNLHYNVNGNGVVYILLSNLLIWTVYLAISFPTLEKELST